MVRDLSGVRRGLLAVSMLFLAGCGGSPLTTYDLNAPRDGLNAARSRRLVVVAEPQALAALDSSRMLITTSEGALNYLPGGQWSDRLPKLLQVRLMEAFENANRIAGVGRPGNRLVPSAQINSEIRRFGIEEKTGEAVIEIAVKIVDDRSGQIIAGEIFTSRVSAPNGNTAAGASVALDAAGQGIMRQIVAWVSRRI